MAATDSAPISPAQFTRGLMVRAYLCGALMVAAVLLGIVFADPTADPSSVPGWFAVEALAGLSRGLLLLIVAVIIDGVVISHWALTGSRRVAAWRARDASA